MENLSQADQQQVIRLNQLSQSIDAIMQQKISMESQGKELDVAIKELETAGETAKVFKSIGGIFVKANQKQLLEESKDKKERIEMRLKSLGTQEERLKKQHEELRKKVEILLKQQGLA